MTDLPIITGEEVEYLVLKHINEDADSFDVLIKKRVSKGELRVLEPLPLTF